MIAIPSYVFLIGALFAWAGLTFTWSKHIHETTEQRRIKAVAKGETAPDVRGSSNYERAELRESAHRAMQVTTREKWIGRGFFFGIPAIIISVFLASSPF